MEDNYMNKTAKRCIFTILLVLVFYAVVIGTAYLRFKISLDFDKIVKLSTIVAIYFMNICMFILGTILAAYLVSRKPVTRVQIGMEAVFIVLPSIYLMCSFMTYLNDKSIVADMASRYEEYLSLAGTVIFTSWAAGIIRSRWINRRAGK